MTEFERFEKIEASKLGKVICIGTQSSTSSNLKEEGGLVI